jgi:peptide/nickel transport system substrate-binding protein
MSLPFSFSRSKLAIAGGLVLSCLALSIVPAAEPAASATLTISSRANTLVGAIAAVPTDMGPDTNQGGPSNETSPFTAATLVRYKQVPATQLPGPYAVEPYLAQSWKRDSDGSYEFTLRDAKSPEGDTITSQDVKWSFERKLVINPTAQTLYTSANIDKTNPITIIDSRTFRINLTEPSALLLATLAIYQMGISDSTQALKHATSTDPWATAWFASHSESYGAYYIAGFIPGQAVFFKANPNYWAPLGVKAIAVHAIPDPSVRLQLLLSGQVDYASGLTNDQIATASKAKNIRVFIGASPQTDVLIPNERLAPFANSLVRKALNMAIDRKAIASSIYGGYARPGVTQLNSAIPLPRFTKVTPYTYDPTAAKALLAQAGYPNGFSFTLTICPCRPGAYSATLATLIQSQLAQVGITANINTVASSAQFTAGFKTYDMYLYNQGSGEMDVFYTANLFYGTNGSRNTFGYSSQRLDFLNYAGFSTAAGNRRDREARGVIKILEADQPLVPLEETSNIHLWNKRVTGYLAGSPLSTGSILADQLSFTSSKPVT